MGRVGALLRAIDLSLSISEYHARELLTRARNGCLPPGWAIFKAHTSEAGNFFRQLRQAEAHLSDSKSFQQYRNAFYGQYKQGDTNES